MRKSWPATPKKPHLAVQKELIKMIDDALRKKRESDEEFETTYADKEAETLVKELRYFISTPDMLTDFDTGEFQLLYENKGHTPKRSPLTSLSELYLLQGWPDDIIDLVKDRLTVHENKVIPLNDITDSQLKVIFPILTDEQVSDFFRYRDGVQEEGVKLEPHQIKSVDDLKNIMTETLGVMDETQFKERIEQLKGAGIELGVAGQLFLIKSVGEFGRSSYTLTAYIELPVKPKIEKKKKKDNKKTDPNKGVDPNKEDENPPDQDGQNDEEKDKKKKEEEIIEYLSPRILEIQRT